MRSTRVGRRSSSLCEKRIRRGHDAGAEALPFGIDFVEALWRAHSVHAALERSALFFFLCASILTVWISSAVVAPLVKLAREAERYPAENAHLRPIDEAGRARCAI